MKNKDRSWRRSCWLFRKRNSTEWWQFVAFVLLFVLLLIFCFTVVLVTPPENCTEAPWTCYLFGISEKFEILKFLGIGIGGMLVAIQIFASLRRAGAMEDAARSQADAVRKTEQGQRQERLKNAIEHLGHTSDSVRLGSAYELLYLARDTAPLRETVLEILCAHIRQTTDRDDYKKMYNSKPSVEIQSLLTLLFVQNHEVFAGIGIDLQGCWLNGVNLDRAHLAKANLQKTHLREAYFIDAQLQDAHLSRAQLQGAHLSRAQLQGAHLSRAQLQGVDLNRAQLQVAYLYQAQLQGADLSHAKLQVAYLYEAQLQGAYLYHAHLQGACLYQAQLQGAYLFQAQLQGANLYQAQLQGADLPHAQLQGASLIRAQLQGVTSEPTHLPLETIYFNAHILHCIGKKSDLSHVSFSGGLSQENLDEIINELPHREKTTLQEKLKLYINKQKSNQLPENSGAITGTYTQQEASIWIGEYEGALSEPSDESNS